MTLALLEDLIAVADVGPLLAWLAGSGHGADAVSPEGEFLRSRPTTSPDGDPATGRACPLPTRRQTGGSG